MAFSLAQSEDYISLCMFILYFVGRFHSAAMNIMWFTLHFAKLFDHTKDIKPIKYAYMICDAPQKQQCANAIKER